MFSMHTAEDVVMYYLDDSLAGHYMAKIRDFVPEGQWAGTRLLMDVPFDPQTQLTANQKFIQVRKFCPIFGMRRIGYNYCHLLR